MILEFLFCLQEAPFARHGWRPLAEQAAIRARFRRQSEIWSTHLAICRNVVRDAAEQCAQSRCAVILGSGLLLDIPIDDLCRRFRRVVLVDLHHPRRARQAKRCHANLELRYADVTGADFWPSLPADTDFLASVNLAAQLALGEGGDQAVLRHIDHLRHGPGLRLMISEWARIELDDGGAEIAREPALAVGDGFALPYKSWKWYLAPPGELAPYRGLALEVGAWLWRE